MKEIEKNDYSLNISRYVGTAETEEEIDLADIDKRIAEAAETRNGYLKQLELPPV